RCLMTLMREKGTVPERDRIIFLDTETTGIQGGTGMCPFLVGVGFFFGDEFQILQFFIRDFDEEPSMLLALTQLLERFKLVITYNGAAFDIPLLETRFTLARLDNPFENLSHYDLLFTTRRLWRHGHGSCRLTALEREMISFVRGPDIPGAMIPRASSLRDGDRRRIARTGSPESARKSFYRVPPRRRSRPVTRTVLRIDPSSGIQHDGI